MIVSLVVAIFFLAALTFAAYFNSVSFDETDEYQLPPDLESSADLVLEPEADATEVHVGGSGGSSEYANDSTPAVQEESRKIELPAEPASVAPKKSVPRNVMNVKKKAKRPRRKN